MREITVISGKGGTGKTSLTGAFAHLATNHVICDLDVDAPDLHLLLQPVAETTEDFQGGHVAEIEPDRCTDCGLCAELCRYGAIDRSGESWSIDPVACEGCKVCVQFCPSEAIAFPRRECGRWYRSKTRFGPMVHAQLFPGEENSGLLVSLLRREARAIAAHRNRDLILSDGAPGIGCPVISSLTGTDLAVLVTEPTPSGRHDLERVADLCAHFGIAAGVIVNKCDINDDVTRDIESLCETRHLPVIGRLPFDPIVTEAMIAGRVITEHSSQGIAALIRKAWSTILALGKLKQAA